MSAATVLGDDDAAPELELEDSEDVEDIDTEIERVSVEVEEETMNCARPDCNNEARAPRGPRPPGTEGWCKPCVKEHGPDASSSSDAEPKPARKPKSAKPKKTRAKAKAAVSIMRPLLPPSIDSSVSIADILEAWALVNSIGVEVVAVLAEKFGATGE